MEDSRRAKHSLHWIPGGQRNKADNALAGRTPFVDYGQQYEKMSVSRHWTVKYVRNGLPNLQVTGRTKV